VAIDELEWLARHNQLVPGVGRQAKVLGEWLANVGLHPPSSDRIEAIIAKHYRELGGQLRRLGRRRAA